MNSAIHRTNAQSPCMARKSQKPTPPPYKETGDRVRLVRLAIGEDNASVFAARVGLSPSHLSNIESGSYDLTKLVGIKLSRAVPGLSTDYLFMGKTDLLSYDLARKIEAAKGKLKT